MNLLLHVLAAFLLTVVFLPNPAQAVEFHVINTVTDTPGGARFDHEITHLYAMEQLQNATTFILQTFQQGETERRGINHVMMTVESMEGIADTEGNHIRLNSNYVGNYSGDVKMEITGIIYHEMTHVWQWNGNNHSAPQGLIEGVADYIRLRAGFAPAHWVKIGSGKQWDEGYTVTAYFLDYCNGLKDGFVASLNDLLKNGYSDEFFVQLLGKPVDELWNDYKDEFGLM